MNTRSTKIRLRIDALNNWENGNSKPLQLGEVGIAYQSVNTAPEGQPAYYEKKNFQVRVGKEENGTHWLSSAPLQADDFSESFYTQLTSQLSSIFFLRSEQEDFAQAIESQFGTEITEIKNRLDVLEQHCKDPAISSETLYWEEVFPASVQEENG